MKDRCQPGRRAPRCPECGEEGRWVGETCVCPRCVSGIDARGDVLDLGGMSRPEQMRTVARHLADNRFVVEFRKQVLWVTPYAAVDLVGDQVFDMLQSRVDVLRPAGDGKKVVDWLPADVARKAVGYLRQNVDMVPHAEIIVPRTVLYRNARGELVPSRRGLHGGVLQTGPDVEPEDTGKFDEFLDMTQFAEDGRSRETYVAWCLSAVCPLEVALYPMLVVHANIQDAGKTWLVRALAWALGYVTSSPIELKNNFGRDLGRHFVGALKESRVLEIDNVTGDESGQFVFENSSLARILTNDHLSCDALYRIGDESVRNRAMFGLTMNSGSLAEDLAVRSIECRLEYDESAPKAIRRGLVGESHWWQPENSRAVLAQLLWMARERWAASAGWERHSVPGKNSEWHDLVWRLTGKPVPGVGRVLRGLETVDEDFLRTALDSRDKWTSAEVTELLSNWKADNPLVTAARQKSTSKVGRILTKLMRAGMPLNRRTLHGVTTWSLSPKPSASEDRGGVD